MCVCRCVRVDSSDHTVDAGVLRLRLRCGRGDLAGCIRRRNPSQAVRWHPLVRSHSRPARHCTAAPHHTTPHLHLLSSLALPGSPRISQDLSRRGQTLHLRRRARPSTHHLTTLCAFPASSGRTVRPRSIDSCRQPFAWTELVADTRSTVATPGRRCNALTRTPTDQPWV